MNSRIYIIGAGAVGKALAVSLKTAGKEVAIIRGSVDHQAGIIEEISVMYNEKTLLKASIEVSTLTSFHHLDGIVVLTNKSFGNPQLAMKLYDKVQHSPIVILQNGLGVEQPFLDRGYKDLYRGILFLTSQYHSDGYISYKPVATSPVGTIQSGHTELGRLVDLINSAHFQFRPEGHIGQFIWEKAIVNSVFNSICPLLETDNGIFQRSAPAFRLAKRIIRECIAVAKAKGIDLREEEVEARVRQISSTSDGQLISTLQDINHGRITEIETLNLEFARLAAIMHMEGTVTETRLLGELIQLKSRLKQSG